MVLEKYVFKTFYLGLVNRKGINSNKKSKKKHFNLNYRVILQSLRNLFEI